MTSQRFKYVFLGAANGPVLSTPHARCAWKSCVLMRGHWPRRFITKMALVNLKNEANVAYYAPKLFLAIQKEIKEEEKERDAQHFICCQEIKAER